LRSSEILPPPSAASIASEGLAEAEFAFKPSFVVSCVKVSGAVIKYLPLRGRAPGKQ
jgi:hypothetical protein